MDEDGLLYDDDAPPLRMRKDGGEGFGASIPCGLRLKGCWRGLLRKGVLITFALLLAVATVFPGWVAEPAPVEQRWPYDVHPTTYCVDCHTSGIPK